MKYGLTIVAMAMALLMTIGCAENKKGSNVSGGVCHIVGTLPSDDYNDKCLYLIAENKLIRDSVGIDSCFVKDRKFEFTTDKNMMMILRMAFKYRFGLQDLLVVTEPGELEVVIDSISSAKGTPNNDSLQMWKDATESRGIVMAELRKEMNDAQEAGDTARANAIKAHGDSLYIAYKNYTRRLAVNLDEGPLKEFLGKMFPTSYKKRMPDGTIKEMPLD